MIRLIDRRISNWMKAWLHKRRDKFINKTIEAYKDAHHPDEQTIADLNKALNLEASRVYAIVDASILRARILQSRYTFWITGVIGFAITIGLSSLSFPISVFVPIMGAFAAWIAGLVAIPFNYNQRVQGGMDSGLLLFETQRLAKANNKKEESKSEIEIQELKKEVRDLQKTVAWLYHRHTQANSTDPISPRLIPRLSLWLMPEIKEDKLELAIEIDPDQRPGPSPVH